VAEGAGSAAANGVLPAVRTPDGSRGSLRLVHNLVGIPMTRDKTVKALTHIYIARLIKTHQLMKK
jgi:hypothetical protein